MSENIDIKISATYRGEAITELVAEAAATVTEANGFDGDEQAAQGCRVVAVGRCVDGGAFTIRTQSHKPVVLQSSTGRGWPAHYRNDWIGE